MATKGPSFSGPTGTGWTSATLAPKLTNLPISDTAVRRTISPRGTGGLPTTPAMDARTKSMHAQKLAEWKPQAEALEKAGDQKSLEKALDLRKKIAVVEAYGTNKPSLDLYKETVNNFKTAHPEYQLTPQEQHGLSVNFSGVGQSEVPSLAESALGKVPPAQPIGRDPAGNPFYDAGGGRQTYNPSEAVSVNRAAPAFAPSGPAAPSNAPPGGYVPGQTYNGQTYDGTFASGGSNLSQYDLTAADYGRGVGPNPRTASNKQTPLESLLASIYPDLAAGAPTDPFADPRAPTSNSTFQNILAGLGQRGSGAGAGWVSGGPSFSGPQAGPSFGANLAATIPGAPPFLAGAINGVNAANPYAQRQAAPMVASGGGFDPLIGLSAISAEQRIQAAQMAKDKAAAQAKWFKSQADQEQMRADQANMSRLKGFSNSGWTGPALPTY